MHAPGKATESMPAVLFVKETIAMAGDLLIDHL